MSNAARDRCPWRSILYVPAHVEKFISRAGASGADAVQLDLEDSVPPELKSAARAALARAVPALRAQDTDVLVRVNRALDLAVPDLQAAVRAGADAISLPKLMGADHVRLLEEVIAAEEAARGPHGAAPTRLIAIVETAAAFAQMQAIASASPRVVALMLGSEDFAMDCGAEANEDVLLYPKQQMQIAASAAGVTALGFIGGVADFRDHEAYRAMVRRSRRFGFTGSTCIHPSLVPILNEEFGVSAAEAQAAHQLLAAYETAQREGRGAIVLDGRMVDQPMAERARHTLQRASAHTPS